MDGYLHKLNTNVPQGGSDVAPHDGRVRLPKSKLIGSLPESYDREQFHLLSLERTERSSCAL